MVQTAHGYVDEFLKASPNASREQVSAFLDKTCKELIGRNEFKQAAEVMNHMSDRLRASSKSVAEQIASIYAARSSTGTGAAALPKGISAGKTAAVMAGVGLLVAGGYALFKQDEKPRGTSWVERTGQSRPTHQGLGNHF